MSVGESLLLRPIGVIRSPFREPAGTPIQPSEAAGIEGRAELFPEYAEALRDLAGFERVWLIYWFHAAGPWKSLVVPFKDDTERGLFATRAPCRPNPLGLSSVRLMAVEGTVLRLQDVDVVDGTPLLDIKPYAPLFDHFPVARAGWLDAARGDVRVADGRFGRRARPNRKGDPA